MQILFVDDDSQMRRALLIFAGAALKGIPFEGFTARDGAEALEMCKEKNFDIIVTDLMMPVKNGWEFLEEFRLTDDVTPVLALSAMIPDSNTPDVSVFNDILYKPFGNDAFKDFLLNQIVY